MATQLNTVLDAIVTALKAIDGTGSYYVDLEDRVTRLPYNVAASGAPVPCLVVSEGAETYDYDNSATTTLVRRRTFFVRGYLSADDQVRAAAVNELLADVERALLADQKLGGSAMQVTVVSNDPALDAEAAPRASFVLEGQVAYRTDLTDPDTNRP